MRKSWDHCWACGEKVPTKSAKSCLGCLHLFHRQCLNRVRKEGKRTSYFLCTDCMNKKPMDRTILREAEA